jgi:hypothetical protein
MPEGFTGKGLGMTENIHLKKTILRLALICFLALGFFSCSKEYQLAPVSASAPPTVTPTPTITRTPTPTATMTPANLVTSWRFPALYEGVGGLAIYGSTLYAVDPVFGLLRAFDLNGNPLAGWTPPSLSHAEFVATDPTNGNIFMTTWVIVSTNNVVMYNPSGAAVAAWNPYGPNCIGLDPSGNVYTTNTAGWIEKYTNSGASLATWVPVYSDMNGIAIHNSTIYVAGEDMVLYSYTMAGVPITSWSIATVGFGIAFDSAGDIYVAGPGSNTDYSVPGPVQKFSPAGVLLAQWGSFASFGLAVDAGNNIYVGDNNTGTIYKFSGP